MASERGYLAPTWGAYIIAAVALGIGVFNIFYLSLRSDYADSLKEAAKLIKEANCVNHPESKYCQ